MNNHNCEGLNNCWVHPRWKISKGLIYWWVDPPIQAPITEYSERHDTHAEAISYAQKEATK